MTFLINFIKGKLRFATALIFAGIICQGQTLNYAYHFDSDRASNIVSLGAKSYYIERSFYFPNCCNEDISLVCVGPNGNVVARSILTGWPWPIQPIITTTPDNALVVRAGSPMVSCDTGPDEYRIWKVDTSGTILWEWESNAPIDQFAVLSDASVYIFCQDKWTHLDPSGSFLNQFTWPIPNMQSLTAFGQGEMVFSYISNNASKIMKVNDSLKILTDQPIQNAITNMSRSSDGSLLGLFNGQVQKYSQTFNYMPISQSALGSGNSVVSYLERNDTVFVAGVTSQKQAFYAVLNSNLQTVHMSISNVELSEPNGITLTNKNKIRITTSGVVENGIGTHNFVGLTQISPTGTLGARHDVGPVNATLTHYSIESYTNYGSHQHNAKIEMDVKIVNYGADTVRTFRLNHYAFVSGSSFCLFGLNKKIERKIPPGDTVTVHTGTFLLKPFYTSATSVQSPPLDICIFSTVPDSSNDNNVTNDTYCLNTTLSLVGISENVLSSGKVILSPNPSSKVFTLTSAWVIEAAELFDISGKEIGNYRINDRSFEFEHNLYPGLYYIRIYSKSNVVTQKVLVID